MRQAAGLNPNWSPGGELLSKHRRFVQTHLEQQIREVHRQEMEELRAQQEKAYLDYLEYLRRNGLPHPNEVEDTYRDYTNSFYHWFGETVRPAFGEEFLVHGSDEAITGAFVAGVSVFVIGAWVGGPAVAAAGCREDEGRGVVPAAFGPTFVPHTGSGESH